MNTTIESLRQKTEAVLSRAYRGLHNVPGQIKQTSAWMVRVSVPITGLSAVDYDTLTRPPLTITKQCENKEHAQE